MLDWRICLICILLFVIVVGSLQYQEPPAAGDVEAFQVLNNTLTENGKENLKRLLENVCASEVPFYTDSLQGNVDCNISDEQKEQCKKDRCIADSYALYNWNNQFYRRCC